jgi:hypothetical protein
MKRHFRQQLYYEVLFTVISSALLIQYMSTLSSNKDALLNIFYVNVLPLIYTFRMIIFSHFKIKPIFYMMQHRFKWWLIVFNMKTLGMTLVVSVISWLHITTILTSKVNIDEIITWHMMDGKLMLSSYLWVLIVVVMHLYWIHSFLFEVIGMMVISYSYRLFNVLNINRLTMMSWRSLLLIVSIEWLLYVIYVIFSVFLVDIFKQTRYNNVAVERSLRSPDDAFIGKKSR